MYIDKVDDMIDKVIDDFYTVVILKNKKFDVISKEINFVKYQKEINEFITEYIKSISLSEIEEIVKKKDSIMTIYDTLKNMYYYIYS